MDRSARPSFRCADGGLPLVIGLILASLACSAMAEPQEIAAEEPAAVSGRADAVELDAVIVDGRRLDGLRTEPVSASVVDADELRLRASASRGNLLRKVPGVTVIDLGNRSDNIIIRGVATAPDGDPNGSGAATYFGDVPLSGLRGSATSADLASYDLERVEVLRGPQGTSYGAGALSGAVRYLPRAADIGAFAGALSTTLKGTRHGNGIGHDVDGFLNIPLLRDVLALRLVGYTFRDDNPIRSLVDGRSGSDLETTGGRLAVQFRPHRDIAFNLHHAHEQVDEADLTRTEAGVGGFATSEYREPAGHTLDLTYVRADWDAGFANLAWIGSRSTMDSRSLYNYGAWYTGIDGTSSIDSHTVADDEAVTQELRFSAVDRRGFDWLVGAYYDRRTGRSRSDFFLSGTDTPAVTEWDSDDVDDPDLPNVSGSLYDTREEQLAAYGEVSWWFGNGIGVTAGLRRARLESSTGWSDIVDGEAAGAPGMMPTFATEKRWSPKVNIGWQRSDDQFYYVQYASTSRPGGENWGFFDDSCPAEVVARVDETFRGDRIRTLEAGAKLGGLPGRASFDGSVYYSRWKDAATYNAVNCGGVPFAYLDNVGEIELYGIEIESLVPLATGLVADISLAYGVSRIAGQDPTYTGGVEGDRMPGNPEWKFSLSLDYERALGESLEFFAGGGVSYTGRYNNGLSGDWSNSAQYTQFPGLDVRVVGTLPGGLDRYSDPGSGDYALLDLNFGLRGKAWSATLFADNLLDSRARTAIGYLSITPDGVATISRVTPRTVGLRLGLEF